jgi:hypothetical protein
MNIKAILITFFFTALLTAIITYYITKQSIIYDPLSNPEIMKFKHETDLRDSLNNAIIEVLKQRIEDKQYIIDNVLQQQITESKNRVKHYSNKKDEEIKYINSLDEMQLQNDINSKLKSRSR